MPPAMTWVPRATTGPGLHPVLGNNLASVLAELGCRREARAALAAARDGLKEGDPWRDNLEQTARDIETSRRRRGKACDALD